jgi:anti-sigma B factor antagonist
MAEALFPVALVGGVPVVTAAEEIDITNADDLRAALGESAAHGPATLVVDLTRTLFCDTAGLHTLVAARKRARAVGGDLILVKPGAAVLRILAITGLDQVFASFTSLDEALAQVSGAVGGTARPGVLPGDDRGEES